MRYPTPRRALFPRMTGTLVAALALLLLVALVAPSQLPVTVHKLSLATLGAIGGYWIDREVAPSARPDHCADPMIAAAANIRRAIVMGAFVIGVTLGL